MDAERIEPDLLRRQPAPGGHGEPPAARRGLDREVEPVDRQQRLFAHDEIAPLEVDDTQAHHRVGREPGPVAPTPRLGWLHSCGITLSTLSD